MSPLEFDGVTLPGRARPRLAAIDLRLEAGECAFLLGPNGAGKSSLLRAALGLEAPSAGTVRLAGTPVVRLRAHERARRVAWLPQQQTFQQGLSALEVVAIARFRFHEARTVAEERARAWLGEVGALELAERRITELSGGEQQRVKLAALLAQEAPLLLLDEPANHLDPAQQQEVYQLLARQWRRGLSVLCITHDINLVALVEPAERVRVLGLDHGRWCFDTRFADPELAGKLARLYGVPFQELEAAGAAGPSRRWFAPARSGGAA